MHPHILYESAKDRQRERIKGADQYRLAMQARAGQPGLTARLLARLGSLMVNIGEQLQKGHTPQSTRTLGWVEK
jgi:hypothetical protein